MKIIEFWKPPIDKELLFYSERHGFVVGHIPKSMEHYKKTEIIVKRLGNARAQSMRPTMWDYLPWD